MDKQLNWSRPLQTRDGRKITFLDANPCITGGRMVVAYVWSADGKRCRLTQRYSNGQWSKHRQLPSDVINVPELVPYQELRAGDKFSFALGWGDHEPETFVAVHSARATPAGFISEGSYYIRKFRPGDMVRIIKSAEEQ